MRPLEDDGLVPSSEHSASFHDLLGGKMIDPRSNLNKHEYFLLTPFIIHTTLLIGDMPDNIIRESDTQIKYEFVRGRGVERRESLYSNSLPADRQGSLTTSRFSATFLYGETSVSPTPFPFDSSPAESKAIHLNGGSLCFFVQYS